MLKRLIFRPVVAETGVELGDGSVQNTRIIECKIAASLGILPEDARTVAITPPLRRALRFGLRNIGGRICAALDHRLDMAKLVISISIFSTNFSFQIV